MQFYACISVRHFKLSEEYGMIGQLILQIVLIVLLALLTCAQVSVVSASESKLDKLTADGNKNAKKIKKLAAKPERFLSAIRSASMLACCLSGAFAAFSFTAPITKKIMEAGAPVSENIVSAASAAVLAVAVTCLMLIFGELIPQCIAARAPEKTALGLCRFIGFVSVFFAPLTAVVKFFANGLMHIFGIDPESSLDTVTEEEILMMSDAGAEKGTIDEDENRIIKNVFAFDDLTAEQVCTHRTDVSVLWSADDISVWEETIHRTRHSVFPVCGESVDNVIGVLDAKDYFRLDDKSRENIMENAVREPLFVHENMKADRLFEQMKQDGSSHFAVVVDEYGGMSGIVTITDLVEQLVGDFADDPEDEPTVKLISTGNDEWTVPGISSLTEVCDELDVELPADKYDTFGGYVIDRLGQIPKNGTQVSLDTDGMHIDVTEVKHHRIVACRVKVLSRPETE